MYIENLWKEYDETKDKEIKKILIENYVELVKIVAGRMYNFYGSKVEYDDLLGYGVLGLIDSIDKFDINKNVKFETYAQIRIKGSMIDNIRKLDWIPRSLRKKSKDLQEVIFTLENKLGRSPTNDEISTHMEMSLNELELLLSNISTFNISSLEETLLTKGDNSFDIREINSTPEEIYEGKEIKELLGIAIDSLNQNERKVIALYYYEELTYKEIGHIMDLSESRISQIHSKSILTIKNYLLREGIDKGF